MMLPQNVHEFVPLAVERALDSLTVGILVCAVAWTWLRVARRQNSASRFFILFILLIGIAVLPFAGSSWLAKTSDFQTSAHSVITLPSAAADYLFLVWAVTAIGLLSRVATGFVALQRIKKACIRVDVASLDRQVQMALQSCSRRVELCISDRVNVPTALGLTGVAKVVLPGWLMDQISSAELRHLVLHEVAHLRRWDDWTNFAQRILGAVLFFHPAVWWLERRISLEREMACDECVLAETGDARGYAKSLANMAERSFLRRTMALAQAAVSRLHDTTLRVRRILGPTPRQDGSKMGMVATGATLGAVAIGLCVFSPNLVRFSEPPLPPQIRPAMSADISASLPKPTLASVQLPPVQKPASAAFSRPVGARKPIASRAIGTETVARTQRGEHFIPVKATRDLPSAVGQPAVLVIYQQMLSSDGSVIMVRQTLWHIVFQQPTGHKQPARTT